MNEGAGDLKHQLLTFHQVNDGLVPSAHYLPSLFTQALRITSMDLIKNREETNMLITGVTSSQ
jgi:hypothetical protein